MQWKDLKRRVIKMNVLVYGFGLMGKKVAQAIRNNTQMNLVGVVSPVFDAKIDEKMYTSLSEVNEKIDAIIDFSHPDVLRKQLTDFKNKEGKWDYIVHAAGATKCLHKEDFFRTNYDGTRHFVEALVALDMIPERFVFISSLSVYGAIREAPCSFAVGKQNEMGWIYAPIQDTDIPAPNTAYGQSKLKAEQYLKSLPDFP